MEVALQVIERIGKSIEPTFTLTDKAREVYTKLIKYFHADPEFEGDLLKGILLIGPTGTGKTLALIIMQIYRSIDNVHFIKDGKSRHLNYEIWHVNQIISGFINDGFDGLDTYCSRFVACFDDLGTEITNVKHFGNDSNVMAHVISERFSRNLLTFATTNYPINILEERYDDRTVSRIHGMFNFIEMNDVDFRRAR